MTLGKSVFLCPSFLLSMLGIISVPSFADRDLNEITFRATLRTTPGNATAIKQTKKEGVRFKEQLCLHIQKHLKYKSHHEYFLGFGQ